MIKKLFLTTHYVLHFFLSFCFITTAYADTTPTVWEVVREQFTLNHDLNQPAVQHQLRWLISHPGYIQQLTKSEPYMYHIVSELKKRHLPGEIALLPLIESAYDPFAYSGKGAAGIWQIMPGTGNELGLKQDWWFDGRRSIRPSTDAALNYLTYLHKFFNGDWLMACAAYDSGEGTVARAIKNNQQSHPSFWALDVPQETKNYVPRLLALAEIIQNPQRYKVQLPNIPHIPYFEEVNIGSQIDLNRAAKLAGIPYKDLIKLNPGYNRWATAPYRPYKLLIPADKVDHFSRNLANFPQAQRVSWPRHQVSAGDNLPLIAKKYHTTVNLIRELNQLKSDSVKSGQYVLIPNSNIGNIPTITQPANAKKPAKADPVNVQPMKQPVLTSKQPYKVIHIVQKTDSYQRVEKLYGVSGDEIRTWNHLKTTTPLRRGQQLVIWKNNKKAPAHQPLTYAQARLPMVKTASQSSHSRKHVVRMGETLKSIALQYHTKPATLLELNPPLKRNFLHPGQQIVIG